MSPAAAAVTVSPGTPAPAWTVRVPGSKSLTNRALLMAGVARGRSRLRQPLLADDTEAMAGALVALGAAVTREGGDWVVDGLGGAPTGEATVECGMAGTVGRFLLPVLAAGHGRFAVDGHAQLRRRPLGPLLAAIAAQGARIEGTAFPVRILAAGLSGGEVDVDASISSQFLSGLLIAAPLARATTTLRFGTRLVSAPYVDLTVAMMAAFAVAVERGPEGVSVRPQAYRGSDVEIEPDASSASYFLASAALTGTTVRLPGIDLETTAQGDIEIVDHLVGMGSTVVEAAPLTLTGPARLHGVEVDMGNSSDVFMTLACVAPFADGPTTIEGIGHARVKESDRIAACAENLRRLGIAVDEGPDRITVHPGAPRPGTRLPTYDDHRIAMAFSLIGTRVPVILEDPGVVAKTVPAFFELWRATGARVEGGAPDGVSDTGGGEG